MNDNHPFPQFEDKIRQAVSIPAASPAFVSRLRGELVRRSVKEKSPWMTLRLVWVIALALVILILIVSTPRIVAAIRQLFGYVPGVGLVENSAGLRILAAPVSVTQEGVTLTVNQAIVYPDHVQIVFSTSGIASENDTFQGADPQDNPTAFCGGVKPGEPANTNGDPYLRLPDGTRIDRLFGSSDYPENVFYAKPVFVAKIPAGVTEMTMVLKCIYGARLGAVPENWEVLLKLTTAAAGTPIGAPVIEVTPSTPSTSTGDNADAGIIVNLEKVVPQADDYSFFYSIIAKQPEENLVALYPASASLVDATGQKTALIYKHPWQPGEKVDLWELQPVSPPAYGPYTLVMDTLFAYYDTHNAVFQFDPGPTPQVGQAWTLDQTFSLGSLEVKLVSAQMVEKDLTDMGLSRHVPGIRFAFQAGDGASRIRISILDNDAAHNNAGQIIPGGDDELSPTYHADLYFEKGIPAGKIPVAVYSASKMITGRWESSWASPDQNGIELLNPDYAVSSRPGASAVKVELKRAVKLAGRYLFFLHLASAEERPDLRYIEPVSVSVIDSTGKKISLVLDGTQRYLATPATLWQYHTTENLAEGPLQVIVEKARVHYTSMSSETPPTQQMLDAHSFIFDAGPAPEIGQKWALDQAFNIGGYQGRLTSAQVVAFDPSTHPEVIDAQGYEKGFAFTGQSADPAVRMNLWLEIAPSDRNIWIPMLKMDGAPGSDFTQTILFQGSLPNQRVKVTFYGLTITLDDTWKVDWTPKP